MAEIDCIEVAKRVQPTERKTMNAVVLEDHEPELSEA